MDAGQDKGMSAEKCAKVICRKLKKEKKEILVGGSEVIMVHIRRFLPRLYYYMLRALTTVTISIKQNATSITKTILIVGE